MSLRQKGAGSQGWSPHCSILNPPWYNSETQLSRFQQRRSQISWIGRVLLLTPVGRTKCQYSTKTNWNGKTICCSPKTGDVVSCAPASTHPKMWKTFYLLRSLLKTKAQRREDGTAVNARDTERHVGGVWRYLCRLLNKTSHQVLFDLSSWCFQHRTTLSQLDRTCRIAPTMAVRRGSRPRPTRWSSEIQCTKTATVCEEKQAGMCSVITRRRGFQQQQQQIVCCSIKCIVIRC